MQYLTINDLIKVLNLSRATIYRKIKNKTFPFTKTQTDRRRIIR